MLIGICGYGQIGMAIGKIYEPFIRGAEPPHKLLIKDLKFDEFGDNYFDIIHICIPYNEQFEEIVKDVLRKHAPRIAVIHSTVKVGTTKKIYDEFPFVLHSPVRGIHPHLYEGIMTFIKFIGTDNLLLGQELRRHFKSLGLYHVKVVNGSKTTELLKLTDTTYYGLCIAYHDFVKKLCDQEGVDFEIVMTEANKTYNKGYYALGKENVRRPVLYPPPDHQIHGHCVCQNTQLLLEQYGSDPLLEGILRHKDY